MYYAELHSGPSTAAEEFENEADAVEYYWKRFGPDLQAVVLDNDPQIEVVWEDTALC